MRSSFLALAALVVIGAPRSASAQDVTIHDPGYAPPTAASDTYCCDGPFWTWQAGVEATYLSLELRALEEDNPFGVEVPLGFEAAPRIWLQAKNANGWGGQVRYWQYDAEAGVSSILSQVVTAGITTDIALDQSAAAEMYAVDAELTRAFQLGALDMTASFGGRHAAIGADMAAAFVVLSGPSLFQAGSVHRTDDFHGGGLTASLAGVLPVGESEWSLYGNLRGSALWGHEHRTGHTTLLVGGMANSLSTALLVEEAELGIVEAQIGAQWQHPLAWNRGLLFVRTAFEYQHWNTTATLPPGPLNGASLLDADLYGVSVAVGLVR